MTFTALAPTYGGAREFGREPFGPFGLGRRPRRFRGLGQTPDIFTLTGNATYHDGGVTRELVARMETAEQVAAWEAMGAGYENLQIVGPWYTTYNGVPDTPVWDVYSIETNNRMDGTVGWAMYVTDLVPVPGGFLPGYVNLDGDTSAVQAGQVTVEGYYPGTRPNNLMQGQPWPFSVTREAAAVAEADPTSGGLDADVDREELIEIRIEAIAEEQGQEAGDEARARYEAGEVTITEPPAQPTEAEEEPPEEEGLPPTGEPPPPVLIAGINPGILAALAAAAILFIPMGGKRKGSGGGGFG